LRDLGVPGCDDFDIDTLADQLRQQAAERSAVLMSSPFISVCARR